MCQQGPIVIVEPKGTFYANVKPKDVGAIVDSLKNGGEPVEKLFYKDPATKEGLPTYHDIPFYAKQKRLVLQNCGKIDPENIDDYLAVGGYDALKKAIFDLTPEAIVQSVLDSGFARPRRRWLPHRTEMEIYPRCAG